MKLDQFNIHSFIQRSTTIYYSNYYLVLLLEKGMDPNNLNLIRKSR